MCGYVRTQSIVWPGTDKAVIQKGRLSAFRLIILLLVVAFIWQASSCSAKAAAKLRVVTTILPLVEFVTEIGGEHVMVNSMVPPGASPHTWEPLPSQLVALTDTALYVKVGSMMEFELTWMPKLIAMNSSMRVVDVSQGITLRQMSQFGNGEIDRSTRSSHFHPYARYDPHVWLSLQNARAISENICEALISADSANASDYVAGKQQYLDQIEQLDGFMREQFREMEHRKFIVLHPAWGYFARDYGLEQIPIEVEGKEPSPRVVADIIDRARNLRIKVIFVSPQFSRQSAEVIAGEIGARTILVDPLARDYLRAMKGVAVQMALAMRGDDSTQVDAEVP